MLRRILQVITIILVILQLALSSFAILKWFKGILYSWHTYGFLPPEERIYSIALDEYCLIVYVNRYIPKDANILSIPGVSIVLSYNIYPRKIFQKRQYAPGEEIIVAKEFLSSRNINYILFDYSSLYHISMVKVEDYPYIPGYVVLKPK